MEARHTIEATRSLTTLHGGTKVDYKRPKK